MSKHQDSKHCSCAGCIEANSMSRSVLMDMVNTIMQHGRKMGTVSVINTSEIEYQKSSNRFKLPSNKQRLYDAMMDDADVPMNKRC